MVRREKFPSFFVTAVWRRTLDVAEGVECGEMTVDGRSKQQEHSPGVRIPRWVRMASRPKHRMEMHNSWWMVGRLMAVSPVVLSAVIWASTHIAVDPALRMMALCAHLVSLVLGFGAVMVADYLVLVWILGRTTLIEACTGIHRIQLLVWIGLAGLTASGALLAPDLSAGITQIKVVLVLFLTVNGIQSIVLNDRIKGIVADYIPIRLVLWSGVTMCVSQICWWGSFSIGFWNATH